VSACSLKILSDCFTGEMKAADSSSSMPHTLSFKAAYSSSSYTEKESLRTMLTLPNFTGVLKAADTSSLRPQTPVAEGLRPHIKASGLIQ
jgi:hypothetical protein